MARGTCDTFHRDRDQPAMLNVTQVLTTIVTETIASHWRALHPHDDPGRLALVLTAAERALGAIGGSDALYHNAEHTAHVTLVGLHILRGKRAAEGTLTPALWSNTVIALLCHDIGYVRGLCRGDGAQVLATGVEGAVFKDVSGSSDAVLMPIHVNRGKRFVAEQFQADPRVDVEFVSACIERTRFPVPDEPGYAETADYPGLVRAADLIGQLSDVRYLCKLAAIFYEFEEVGFNRSLGYERPGDLRAAYPRFFDSCVAPYIKDAARFLEQSSEGREILDQLYANLAAARGDQPGAWRHAAGA